MNQLTSLGWNSRFDTFETYYKKIGDYEIIVSKHISETKWDCTLVEWNEEVINEITLNSDYDFEWIIKLVDVLEK